MSCPFCGNDRDDNIQCIAKKEDIIFGYTKTTLKGVKSAAEDAVQVVQPVFTCGQCKESWTDRTGEVIREMVVNAARVEAEKVIKDCPCCGREQSTEDWVLIDALYPTGTWWVPDEEFGIRFQRHDTRTAVAKPIYKYSCNETAGGCGLEIHGFDKQECLDNWNTRRNKFIGRFISKVLEK